MTQVGLSGAQLKILALLLMTLDHIYEFFAFTGAVPFWFRQAGRLAAPIFFFCLAEGFYYTGNRQKYRERIYRFSIALGLAQLAAERLVPHPHGVTFQYNIFSTMFLILLFLSFLEGSREEREDFLPFFAAQTAAALVLRLGKGFLSAPAEKLILLFLPLPQRAEGGVIFLLMGICFYCFRDRAALRSAVFLLLSFLTLDPLAETESLSQWLLGGDYCQWMMCFALIPLAFYNGKKGERRYKELFYWYYPLHMIAFYLAGALRL